MRGNQTEELGRKKSIANENLEGTFRWDKSIGNESLEGTFSWDKSIGNKNLQ